MSQGNAPDLRQHSGPMLEQLGFFQDGWAHNPFEQVTPTDLASLQTQTDTETDEQPRRASTFGPKPDYIQEDWDQSDLNWEQIRELVSAVSNELSQEFAGVLGSPQEREQGREVIARHISRWVGQQMSAGQHPDQHLQSRMTKAVFDSLFGLGRLQVLIDSEHVENIEIQGCDVVHVELVDGTLVDGPPIAESDEDLIRDIQFWASRSRQGRSFAPATPTLNLALGTSARLAAMAWVTLRPVVTVRLHRVLDTSLEDMIARGTVTPVMADFLRAMMLAGESVVVSGAQGAGKTTLCRALCATLPPTERLITFETDRELHLESLPQRHPRVFGVEARPGSGEFRGDGREAGRFDVGDGLREALRHNGDRLLVGEVRGSEIIAMIEAMQSGAGSISTAHARNARDTYERLVTLCLKEDGVSEAFATRAIAASISYIVFVRKVQVRGEDGRTRRVRRVTEIVAMTLTAEGPSFTDVFTSRPGQVARARHKPPYFGELVEAGLDEAAFVQEMESERSEV